MEAVAKVVEAAKVVEEVRAGEERVAGGGKVVRVEILARAAKVVVEVGAEKAAMVGMDVGIRSHRYGNHQKIQWRCCSTPSSPR